MMKLDIDEHRDTAKPASMGSYVLFWATGILDNQLGGLLGNRSATGLGERLMAATFIIWQLALAISVRRVAAPERTA